MTPIPEAAVEAERWKQERPTWCPHRDCQFRARSQDAVCIGEMSKPGSHAGTSNTHRLCQRGAEDDGSWLHKVEWNKGDAWNFRRVIDAVSSFGKPAAAPLIARPDAAVEAAVLAERGKDAADD